MRYFRAPTIELGGLCDVGVLSMWNKGADADLNFQPRRGLTTFADRIPAVRRNLKWSFGPTYSQIN